MHTPPRYVVLHRAGAQISAEDVDAAADQARAIAKASGEVCHVYGFLETFMPPVKTIDLSHGEGDRL
jgi:hypothetical protein